MSRSWGVSKNCSGGKGEGWASSGEKDMGVWIKKKNVWGISKKEWAF